MISPQQVEEMIKMPDAQVQVQDLTGGDHHQLQWFHRSLTGLVQQHQLIYGACSKLCLQKLSMPWR